MKKILEFFKRKPKPETLQLLDELEIKVRDLQAKANKIIPNT